MVSYKEALDIGWKEYQNIIWKESGNFLERYSELRDVPYGIASGTIVYRSALQWEPPTTEGKSAENLEEVSKEEVSQKAEVEGDAEVYRELDEIEKVYDDIFEQQRNPCVEYEEYLDELKTLQGESDILVEGALDTKGYSGFAAGMSPEDAVKYNNWVDLREAGLDQVKINDIILTNKGYRPDPVTYLRQDYIDAHLAQFDEGVSVIQTEWAYSRYSETNGFVGVPDDNSLFVMPKKYCDEVISKANGNLSVIEKELGFPEGYFCDGGGLIRIDATNIAGLDIHFPSGNETGANKLWIPGGKTSGGVPEAITNTIPLEDTIITRIAVD